MKRFAELFGRISTSTILRGIAVLVSGTVFAQIMPILATPLLTRIYTPAEMGQLGLFTAFLGISVPLASLQYSKAIVSAAEDEEAESLFVLCLLLLPVTTILLVCFLTPLVLFDLLGFGELPILGILLAGLAMFTFGLFTTYRYWALRKGRFSVIARATVWQSSLRLVSQLGFGAMYFGSVGLMMAEVIGRSSGTLNLRASSLELTGFFQRLPTKSNLITVARKFFRFPLLSTPGIFINTLALSAPVPLFTMWYGTDAGGQFSVASRIMLVPMSLIGVAVGDVFHNRLAVVAKTNLQEAKPLFLRVSLGLTAFSFVFGTAIFMLPGSFWTRVLGEEWHTAGQLTVAMIPWLMAQFIVSPLSQVVPVFQRQDLKLVYDVLGLLTIVIGIWVGQNLGWSLLETVSLLGITQAGTYIVFFVMLYLALPGTSESIADEP